MVVVSVVVDGGGVVVVVVVVVVVEGVVASVRSTLSSGLGYSGGSLRVRRLDEVGASVVVVVVVGGGSVTMWG